MGNFTSQWYAEYNARNKARDSKPQQVVPNEPLGKNKGEAPDTGRIAVRITSFRRRLIDPDNLCPKYFIDGLRYAGLIPNDRQEDITLQVDQVKVKSKSEERTKVELMYNSQAQRRNNL